MKNVTIGDLFGYMKESFGMLRHHLKLVISSAVIGTVIGAIPGTGEDIASWVAYDSARRGLMAGKYSLSLFLTRPVSAALAILLVIFVVLPIIRDKRSKAKSKTE